MLLTGLRGVGKTVLLNEVRRKAEAQGYRTIIIEAHEEKELPALLAPPLRTLLYDLDRMEGMSQKVRKGLAVLKGFLQGVRVSYGEIGIGIDPVEGIADSGDLEADLPELLAVVAEAAEDRGVAVAILIDELQYLDRTELSALIMAMHKMQQRQLPLVLVGAGLPVLYSLVGDSKSYAERLFDFPEVGPLTRVESDRAVADPLKAHGVAINEQALREVFNQAQGYPYFIQEWGYRVWNCAESSPITANVVKAATPQVIASLDKSFFRVRFDRLTPRQKDVLRAMAELGAGPHRTGEVAEALGVQVTSLGPVRAELLNKGMIYSPSHGHLAFTVPLFDEFMRRIIPEFEPT